MKKTKQKPFHEQTRAEMQRAVRRTFDTVKNFPIEDGNLPVWCGLVFRGGQLLYIAELLKVRRSRPPDFDMIGKAFSRSGLS